MSNKNFDEKTINNFVNSMKDHNGKISFKVSHWQNGVKAYKKKNNCGTVSGIEAFESLKKDVLLAIIQAKQKSEIADRYNKFDFKDTADLKKEDLLNKLLLSDGCIRDLLDLVADFCLGAKDFEKALDIFLDICITTKDSDLRKAKLKFMSKFERSSLTWKQIQQIWKIGNNQQAHSEDIYFRDYVGVVHSALETLEEKQEIAYDAGFIKNFVVNMLRPNDPTVKNSTDIKWLKEVECQELGDYLFGVICMLLIHSKEYLEGRKMDALNDFFGDNKKGSFSSKIGSNILEIIGGGFVGALFAVYLNDGCFEKSQNEYVVKLRDMLKVNQCELRVESNEHGEKIVFKNNQEKTVESHLENMEGKIMSNKNFDQNTITAFANSMKDEKGQSLVKPGPWKMGLQAYKNKNNNKTVSDIEKFKNLKKNVLLSTIEAAPNSEIAQKYNEFQFEDTAMLKKEDLLDKLTLSNNRIQDLLGLVDNCCLNAEDFEVAKEVFSDICISNKLNLGQAKLRFMSKVKKGALTWQQIEEIWKICSDKEKRSIDGNFKFDDIYTVYPALEAIKESAQIDYAHGFMSSVLRDVLLANFTINDQEIDFSSLNISTVQKLGDYLFGVIYMLLIHSKEYLGDRKMDALNDFFGNNEKGSFSSEFGYNILEEFEFCFAGGLSIRYLKDGYFEKSQNEYVVKLRDMLKENQCELKVENDEEGTPKIVFKNDQETTVEQPLAGNKQNEKKDEGVTVVDANKILEMRFSQAPIMFDLDGKRIYYKNDPEIQKRKDVNPGIQIVQTGIGDTTKLNKGIQNPKEENTNDNKNSFKDKKINPLNAQSPKENKNKNKVGNLGIDSKGNSKAELKEEENKNSDKNGNPNPSLMEQENPVNNQTQTTDQKQEKQETEKGKDSATQHRTSLWILALEKIGHCVLFIITLGAVYWLPKLIEKPDVNIFKSNKREVNKSALPNTIGDKGKNKNISPNIKLENENNKGEISRNNKE